MIHRCKNCDRIELYTPDFGLEVQRLDDLQHSSAHFRANVGLAVHDPGHSSRRDSGSPCDIVYVQAHTLQLATVSSALLLRLSDFILPQLRRSDENVYRNCYRTLYLGVLHDAHRFLPHTHTLGSMRLRWPLSLGFRRCWLRYTAARRRPRGVAS